MVKVITYFEGRPELKTSYANQRGLAARAIGGDFKCLHGVALGDFDGCLICRTSGCVLLAGE